MKSTTALFLWLLIALAACDEGSRPHGLHEEDTIGSPSPIRIQDLSYPGIFPETAAVKSIIAKDGKPVCTSMTASIQASNHLLCPPESLLNAGKAPVLNHQMIEGLELSPGQYVFKIWAADVNDQWVETANFTFTIRPSWRYFAVCILILLFSIWSYNQWRAYALHKRSHELETLVNQTAEAANEAKSNFLSTISHELRTPLTSIIGFSKLNRKYLTQNLPNLVIQEAKAQKRIHKIDANPRVVVSESERILSLINGLFDLAKIESGAMEWKMAPVDAGQLIESAAAATASLFEQKPELELVTEIPDHLPVLTADRGRIVQVLINLISNAVKFTDAGAVTLGVRLSPSNCGPFTESFSRYGWGIEDKRQMIKNNVGTSGHQDVLVSPSSLPATPRKHTAAMAGEGDSSKELIFTVQDTGAGIPHKYLDQIFEKFKQADQSQTDKPKGTGLGLPICKEIVEHHGGRIWVNSLPGRGSTFAFSLPVD